MEDRIELAKQLAELFVLEERGFAQTRATDWLIEKKGFDDVHWFQPTDDILFCLLWRGRDRFLIEFSGYDAMIISIFESVKEIELG